MHENRRTKRLTDLLSDLRNHQGVSDFRFDAVFPRPMRELSETHWTPVEVAVRASELLASKANSRILDVGSGCGKLCLIGALTTESLFVGVEQRESLVNIAKETRDTLFKGARTVFVLGNMADLDWSRFDAFYLYNPFYEHIVDKIRIDESLGYSEQTFAEYVNIVELKLAGLKVGTRVVTYHGFGGNFPMGYSRLLSEPAGTGILELWEKISELSYGVPSPQ